MSHTILLTGVSGYLGGTLLTHLHSNPLPPQTTIYALIRNVSQSSEVEKHGVHPLLINTADPDTLSKAIIDAKITIIFFLIDAINHETQICMIEALAEVKKKTGLQTHFLHTSGAKLFSGHAGHGVDDEFLDTDPGLFDMQKSVRAPHEVMQKAVNTNTTIISTAESLGVRSYIFIPCIVYGEGEGFGNKISIQTVAIVRAAKRLRRVYDVNRGQNATWPVCHILDNTSLYLRLLHGISAGEELGYGTNGYYLASSGNIAWSDLYSAMAKALTAHGTVDDDIVKPADDAILEEMGKALGVAKDLVPVQLGGRCALRAVHGGEIGWKAKYPPEHILETADVEVDLILRHVKN